MFRAGDVYVYRELKIKRKKELSELLRSSNGLGNQVSLVRSPKKVVNFYYLE